MSSTPAGPAPSPSSTSDAAVLELAGELRGAIAVASRRIRAERGSAALSDPQYSALMWLSKHGSLTPGQLAELERIQPPAMTRTVGCLVERGLVRKDDHPTDGRAVVVSLTQAGVEEVAETRHRRLVWLAARLETLTPDEKALLVEAAALLRRIATS
ncbi:MarR family winged helix-turn-helix transcriptional regulator [Cellulomonas composti]|uniref:Putative HTH-type transcriptional regulator MarR n=1 Tax=Cellulomonas composti TaxID=266130 RepID=A0A511JCW4_9CELL|nr:MarR family transcriptional regulator [Cellulomonas composti]GEL95840.1 putative HTH-type transcriptional regulator MarR [Cellulomonas composti]